MKSKYPIEKGTWEFPSDFTSKTRDAGRARLNCILTLDQPYLQGIPISKHVHVHDNAAFYHDDNTLCDENHFCWLGNRQRRKVKKLAQHACVDDHWILIIRFPCTLLAQRFFEIVAYKIVEITEKQMSMEDNQLKVSLQNRSKINFTTFTNIYNYVLQ